MYDIEDYIQVFRDILGLEEEEDIRTASCDGIEEWDSYAHMELMTAIEECFRIRLDGEDVLHFLSFEEGLEILERKGITFEPV